MKKVLSLLLALLMMAGLLAGCAGGEENPSTPTSTEPSSAPSYEAPVSTEPGSNEIELPLTEDDVTFDYWVTNSASFEGYSSFNDNLFYQWMEEKTGVHLNFIHPTVGSENENFQTMILSNDYPDFISFFSNYYSGGVDKAINDGVLRRLNELVNDYMPNYKATVYRDEETFIRAISDSGNLWGIHHIVDYAQGAWLGLGVRSDWLDKAGLTIEDASTIDGMEQVLTAFKEYTNDNQGPLFLSNGGLNVGGGICGSYGAGSVLSGGTRILNVDGKATYSPTQPGFKEYVAKMADWYARGLVNTNYIADARSYAAEDRWINSEIGLAEFVYTMASNFAALAATNENFPQPDFHISALATPKLTAGMNVSKDVHIRQTQELVRTNYSMGITTGCTDDEIELACRYWDYVFSPDGVIASNWGPTEGAKGDVHSTYFVDPTDANGDGHVECYQPWLMEQCGNVTNVQYKVTAYMGPSYCIWSREWCALSEEEINYTKIWDSAGNDWMWPGGVTLTADEGSEASAILSGCNTAVTEWTALVITGQKSVDTYESELMGQLETLNISRAEELYQNALDRYLQRAQYLR